MTTVPAAALAWAAAAVGPHATVESVRAMAGGTHAATHLLRFADPAGDAVLKRYPAGDPAAGLEAAALTALDGLDGWAPRLIAADPTGEQVGAPATLFTRLPGRSDIVPTDPHTGATEMARILARVHATPTDRLGPLRDGARAAIDGTTPMRSAAPTAWAVLPHEHRLVRQPPVLTHYDYWTGNVLWEGDAIVGVIDWAGAAQAPRGYDVSWCRLDLVLLHHHATAATFLTSYECAAGQAVPDVLLWDLFVLTNSHHVVETWLPNYHDLGRTDLTAADLRDRHTRWASHCLARLDNA
ncbi:MAG TPA: aminoglycoside phosphotransferase family protein [Pseudonocardiaceae bacterium]|nr:aminoglycoside phosphotransferase family protein [Pseudonocardiaceae bacterium]